MEPLADVEHAKGVFVGKAKRRRAPTRRKKLNAQELEEPESPRLNHTIEPHPNRSRVAIGPEEAAEDNQYDTDTTK